MKIKKRIAAMGAATVMAISMMSVGASAGYVHSATYDTSGGTNGYVRIKSGVYKGVYEPSGGVHVTTYGARAEITNASTVTTTFRATPHNHCRTGAQSDFSSDCIEISQAY